MIPENHVYLEGGYQIAAQGLAAVEACEALLVGQPWEFDKTHTTEGEASEGEIAVLGYARQATTLTLEKDVNAPYPTLRYHLSEVLFPPIDVTGVRAVVILLADGTPFGAFSNPSGISSFPLDLIADEPLQVTFPPLGAFEVKYP